jgi:hypothetical protein
MALQIYFAGLPMSRRSIAPVPLNVGTKANAAAGRRIDSLVLLVQQVAHPAVAFQAYGARRCKDRP